MSLEAYQRLQAEAESPQETEYRLFGRVTGALIEARDNDYKAAKLMEALDWNRRMWSTFANDCAQPGNQLPDEVRAQIISLSIYVTKTTSKVMRGQAAIDDLIEINQNIMKGLAMQFDRSQQTGQSEQTAPGKQTGQGEQAQQTPESPQSGQAQPGQQPSREGAQQPSGENPLPSGGLVS